MVYVDDKKFACESCIKGHRSSGCQHTDRPLFEVKKKGRPVSQCEKCRELRKTKRMHGKCNCAPGSATENKFAEPSGSSAAKGKAPRFKPIAPALPNGLRDVRPSEAEPELGASVNLCRCGGKDASICTCAHERAPARPIASDGLATLAQAAMYCCSNDPPSDRSTEAVVAPVSSTDNASRKRNCCSSAANSRPPSPKPEPKRSKHVSYSAGVDHALEPSFPSLSAATLPYSQSSYTAPVFPPIAPLGSAITFDEAKCCCGTQCACPGCTVHRGVEHVAKDHQDCTDGECRTCVDHDGGIALPEDVFAYSQGGTSNVSQTRSTHMPPISPPPFRAVPVPAPAASGRERKGSVSHFDAFFATAAALPAPPPGRTGQLDPTNVLVYPRGVLAGDTRTRSLFGLVEVPKLQCNCPGGCGCPEGQCGCGDGCTGCGRDEEEEEEVEEEQVPVVRTSTSEVRSCCSG